MGDKPGHEFHGNQWTEGHQAALAQHLTREDRKLYEREVKKYGRGNPYALGIILNAADEMHAEIKAGKDPSKAFSDNFTPTASNHRVAKKLGLDLDVERGQWVAKPFVDKAAEREARVAEFHARNGSLDFTKEEAKASKMTDAELQHAREDAHAAATAMGRDNPKEGYYKDQGSVYAREQAKRANATGRTRTEFDSPEKRIAEGRAQPGDVRQAGQREAATIGHANYLRNLRAQGAPDLEHLSRENAKPANAAAIEHAPGSNREVYGARAGKSVTGKLVQGADGYWRETKKGNKV